MVFIFANQDFWGFLMKTWHRLKHQASDLNGFDIEDYMSEDLEKVL